MVTPAGSEAGGPITMHRAPPPATARTARASTRVALLAVVVLAGAACDDGDPESSPSTASADTADVTTTIPATTDAPTTTESPSTTESAPAATEPTPTSPTPTTFDEEALMAQIEADFLAADQRLMALMSEPSLADLDLRVSRVATPGPYYDILRQRVEALVAAGERVVLGDPPVHSVAVEQVNLVGTSSAEVISCVVDNGRVVRTGADGRDEVVGAPRELTAVRDQFPVTLTDHGWLIDNVDSDALGIWTGADSCPPS